MTFSIRELQSPLFNGIEEHELHTMLGCIGYHIGYFRKGEIIAFEDENIRHIGILLSGTVDMVKEDLWGNKAMLVRMRKDELFGETFACETLKDDSLSADEFYEGVVSYFEKVFSSASAEQKQIIAKINKLGFRHIAPGHGVVITDKLEEILAFYTNKCLKTCEAP